MRCIAIDDEPLALKLLTQYSEKIPSIKLIGTYTDPVDALSYIKAFKPDLLFLDIHMPDISGIEIARTLNRNTLVIFTTAYKDYAIEGFELEVVDYLMKPFSFERFRKAYIKAEERFKLIVAEEEPKPVSSEDTIIIKHDYHNLQLPVHSILYIEASNNNVKIVTPNEVFSPVLTMKMIAELLPENEFIRVHKSFILPISKIRSFNKKKVVTEKIEVPIGRVYYKDFVAKIMHLKAEKY